MGGAGFADSICIMAAFKPGLGSSLWFAMAVAVAKLSSSLSSCSQSPGLNDITQTQVYAAGEGGYHCFRIPALLLTGKGTLLAFAEGRGQHTQVCADHGDVHIVVKRSSDLGQTWSSLAIVYQESGHTIGNAAPLLDQSSDIITLVFCRDNTEVFSLQSSDDGATWVDLRNITAAVREPQWGFTGSGPPGGIQLPSGRLVIGMYAVVPGSYVIFSDDGGKSWSRSQPIGAPGSGECQVAALNIESDSPVLVMASRSNAGRYISYSKDSGESWFNTSVDKSLDPQTPCESSIVSMTYRGVYLNTHLYLTAPHSAERENMTLFTSSDGGYSWSVGQQVIWSGPSAYSSLAYHELKLYCLYERGDAGKEYWSNLTLAVLSPLIQSTGTQD